MFTNKGTDFVERVGVEPVEIYREFRTGFVTKKFLRKRPQGLVSSGTFSERNLGHKETP